MSELNELKTKKKKNGQAWTKWFLVFGIVMIGYTGFTAGLAAQQHHYAVMGSQFVPDGILGSYNLAPN